jgi:hypothetical protein
MGSSNAKPNDEDLMADIERINLITKSELFQKKTGLTIQFSYCIEKDLIHKMFNNKLILLEVVIKIDIIYFVLERK